MRSRRLPSHVRTEGRFNRYLRRREDQIERRFADARLIAVGFWALTCIGVLLSWGQS